MAEHAAHDPGSENLRAGEPHVVSVGTYLAVFTALMVLLVITLVAAAINFGPAALMIALVIAVLKAGLILAFFMHLKFSTPLVKFFALAALFWLGIMFFLTMSDYDSRSHATSPGGIRVPVQQGPIPKE